MEHVCVRACGKGNQVRAGCGRPTRPSALRAGMRWLTQPAAYRYNHMQQAARHQAALAPPLLQEGHGRAPEGGEGEEHEEGEEEDGDGWGGGSGTGRGAGVRGRGRGRRAGAAGGSGVVLVVERLKQLSMQG